MPARLKLIIGLTVLIVSGETAFAGKNVAVVDNFGAEGESWCDFLMDNGHTCTLFPKEGPTAPLDPFDVVIDMSGDWTDPAGSLADFLRAGKTVITVDVAPGTLGVQSNPTVQAWIGANAIEVGELDLITVTSDPILGETPPGTFVTDCGAGVCLALLDTSGHPNAKVLAAFADDAIGIMRNVWEGGASVFFTDNINPGGAGDIHNEMILNAVRARELTVPTLGQWGLLVLALALAAGGSAIVIDRKTKEPNQNLLSQP
jgi:hypothetical protein